VTGDQLRKTRMLVDRRRSLLTVTVSMLAAAAVLTGSVRFAHAEEPTLADEILKALAPSDNTRSLSGARAEPTPEQVSFVESLKKKTANSLAPGEREKLATLTKDKPNFDVKINFDFDSDRIGPAAAQAVNEVGKALLNSQLAGNTFVLAGHTDAKGTDAYNQDLSERRAEAVKRYLVETFKIPAENLVAVGYGKTTLKNASNPFAPENRRVQIVNMADKSVANRQ
jgi:outer membrane protein OmpA-like peptidoglycan-associated protein